MTEGRFPPWRLDAVDADAMAAWTDLLRDDNPIHVDPAAAEALGFGPRTVNPGPINLAYALNMLLSNRTDVYPMTVEARFLGNILAGDAVDVTGASDAADPRSCHVEVRSGPDRALALDIRARMASPGDRA